MSAGVIGEIVCFFMTDNLLRVMGLLSLSVFFLCNCIALTRSMIWSACLLSNGDAALISSYGKTIGGLSSGLPMMFGFRFTIL